MVTSSKILEPPVCYHHCSQTFLHPGIGCLHSYLKDIVSFSTGNFKYFLPLLISPLVLKGKKMNRELFVATVKNYLGTVFWGSLASANAFLIICIYRNCLGRYYLYTTVFMPTATGMFLTSLFFPERAGKLFFTATAQGTLESLLRQHDNPVTRLLLRSTSLQTFLFMISSAITLHYKRMKTYRGFSFIQPYEKVKTIHSTPEDMNVDENFSDSEKRSDAKCVHGDDKTCSQFIWEGIKASLYFGIPLDLLSAIMKGKVAQGSQSVLQMAWTKLKGTRPNLSSFFVFYSGIYRLSSCLLKKYYGHLAEDLQHVLAAFLGGSSYLLLNRVSFLIASTVIATEIMWDQFCRKYKEYTNTSKRKPNFALKLLTEIRLAPIIFGLSMGYLVNNYMLDRGYVSNLAQGFVTGVTNNKAKNIRDNAINATVEELVQMARKNPVKIFF